MLAFLRRYFPLFLLIGAFVAVVALYLKVKNPPAPSPPPPSAVPATTEEITAPPPPILSPLADPPDWKQLDKYQNTITRSEFERMLGTIFTVGEDWRKYIRITESNAIIQTENDGIFFLRFAATDSPHPPRPWRSTDELPAAPADRPLEGIHIAIDPGHIGGEWAKIEERWFVLGEGKPVTEGDMTLDVARRIAPRLEALGARVTLVRDKAEPITPIRPDDLMALAAESAPPGATPAAVRKLAERLFYRTAEIRDRARLVNETIKPDLVLCLHFNAEGWGDPNNPTLIPRTHFHVLLNGAYNNEEIAMADQRFTAVHKILQRTYHEEVSVGSTLANVFAEISRLPAYQYNENPNVRAVPGQPFLWCRNLLANRLYDCPVIFMEPYVMNSTLDYARMQAGDYEGLREIEGEMRPSIFREYADGLVEGLRRHYSEHRRKAD